ncbi:hypothetical protein GCM10007908_36680 [Rhizobium albus]|jgi:hypothetical protein|nr:hypothetical protein GCM10007908_36680 [Rhizobium albus]
MWTGNLAIWPAERKTKGAQACLWTAWIMGKRQVKTRRPAAAPVFKENRNAAVGRPPPSPGSGHAAADPRTPWTGGGGGSAMAIR